MRPKTVKWPLKRVQGDRPVFALHAVLITCRCPRTHSCSTTSVYQMDTIKKDTQKRKARSQSCDRPRVRARTTSARLPRSTSPEPATTHGHVISTASSAIVPASQAAVEPTANTPPSADIPALETERSPRPERTPSDAATYAQPGVKTEGEERQAVEADDLKKTPEDAMTTGQ